MAVKKVPRPNNSLLSEDCHNHSGSICTNVIRTVNPPNELDSDFSNVLRVVTALFNMDASALMEVDSDFSNGIRVVTALFNMDASTLMEVDSDFSNGLRVVTALGGLVTYFLNFLGILPALMGLVLL